MFEGSLAATSSDVKETMFVLLRNVRNVHNGGKEKCSERI